MDAVASELGLTLPDPGSAASPSLVADASPRAPVQTTMASRESRFRSMVDAYFDFIWHSLCGLGVPEAAADDAAQHVFWVAAQRLDSIVIGSEKSFLFSTALGVAANHRRARARSREVADVDALDEQIDEAPNPEELIELKWARARLDSILESMPVELRTVFVLFELEEQTTGEIAALLGLAPGTVASRLRRAREAFQTSARRAQAQSQRGRIR